LLKQSHPSTGGELGAKVPLLWRGGKYKVFDGVVKRQNTLVKEAKR